MKQHILIFIALLPVLNAHEQENCCHKKLVNGKSYTLLAKGDTSKYNCKDNCIYTDETNAKFCFQDRQFSSQCMDNSDTTKYFYHIPSTIFDLEELPASRQSSKSKNVNVTSHTDGYSTASGACVSATVGVFATAHIEVTITATSQKEIKTLGNTIKEHLKESFQESFDEEFQAGYSLDVGWDWTGVSSDGDINESSHEEAYENGEEGMEAARTSFTQAVQEQNTKTVTIVGDATLEGESPIPATYCIYFAVQKVEFTDGSEVYVVNDNQRTAKTATTDGQEVPNKDLKLTVVPGTG